MAHSLTLLATRWSEHQAELIALRHDVFIVEQHVPVTEEVDEKDLLAQHFLVLSENTAVACARWIELPDNVVKIGRFAVRKPWRNNGIGRRLLQFILEQARMAHKTCATLDAQTSAIGFYQKQNFVCCSDTFMDAGIPHQTMQLPLK